MTETKMRSYKYICIDSQGKRVKGSMDATNKGVCLRYLEGKRMEVLSCVEYSNILTKLNQLNVGAVINQKNLLFFLKQLGSLLTSGIKLIDALELLALQQENKAVRRILFIVHQEVYNGNKFSDVLQMYPKDFPSMLISMVQVGEMTGELGQVIKSTADYMETQANLQKQIKGAIRSPLMYFLMAVAVTVAMLLFVFPSIESSFAAFGADLPGITKFFMKLEQIIKTKGLIVLAVVAAIIVLYLIAHKKSEKFRMAMAKFTIKIPLIGTLIQMQNQIAIANSLAQLMSRGVTATDSLAVTKKVVKNPIYTKLLDDAYDNVVDGKSFAKAFEESMYIEPTMSRMIATGEKTSEIPRLLMNLSTYYNDVSEVQVKAIKATLQPFMMLFVYALVLMLMLAIMLPQLQLGMSAL